jgi:hypothetical protein
MKPLRDGMIWFRMTKSKGYIISVVKAIPISRCYLDMATWVTLVLLTQCSNALSIHPHFVSIVDLVDIAKGAQLESMQVT